MIVTRVEDEELLYRAVRAGSNEFTAERGVLRITVNAFADRSQKPSVDRSAHRSDPRATRFRSEDGVTSVVTRDVRAITSIQVKPSDPKDGSSYAIDAIHRPIAMSVEVPTGNSAHCQIESDPTITPNHYKKLKEALAFLATKSGWVVEPGSD
jgi:hypothetical protein